MQLSISLAKSDNHHIATAYDWADENQPALFATGLCDSQDEAVRELYEHVQLRNPSATFALYALKLIAKAYGAPPPSRTSRDTLLAAIGEARGKWQAAAYLREAPKGQQVDLFA